MKRKFELKILDQFQAFIIEDVWANYNPELIKMDLGKTQNRRAADTCFYKTKAEYSARLQEINAFFQEWAPPPRVRPTSPILLHGMRFGTKKRPPIKVDADSASD